MATALSSWARLIRWPNLLIIALVQILVFYQLWDADRMSLPHGIYSGLAFTLCTVCVAAAGFIINDIMDQDSDRQGHRPSRQIIGYQLSPRQAYRAYYLSIGLGALLAIYIASFTGRWSDLWIYPISVLALHLYSTRWKRTVLIGNLVVATLCAAVILLVLYAVIPPEDTLSSDRLALYLGYTSFAWLSTFIRELIKDAEDVYADDTAGYRTLPVLYGTDTSDLWIMIGAILLIVQGIYWCANLYPQYGYTSYAPVGVIIPFSLCLIHDAYRHRVDYPSWSRRMKYLILLGTLLLIIFPR